MPDDNLGDELKEIFLKIAKNVDNELTKNEINEIVSNLIPELDKLIAEKIKLHFKVLAKHIVQNIDSFIETLKD